MEVPSGMHGNFKITKPNRFSNVQKYLKPWLTMVTIDFRAYLTLFLLKKQNIYSQSHILIKQFFIGYNPDWNFF